MHFCQESSAANATRVAYETARTMTPGDPGQSILLQLGLAHESKADKETVFLNNVWQLGLTFRTKLDTAIVEYPTGQEEHPYLPLVSFAAEVLHEFPEHLLGGFSYDNLCGVENCLEIFWDRFKWTWPEHPVYQDHAHDLRRCIPCRLHCDEGTGVRRTGIMQISWGPVIKSALGSAFHYFFHSCIHSDVYKDFNQGYKVGNKTLDDIMECFVSEALTAYWEGVQVKEHGTFFLVFVRQEGDLPAQAKIWHLDRSFTNFPNPMCCWCMADGNEIDFADFRQNALWRSTVQYMKPWSTVSPMVNLPGGNDERFLAKDLFHLSNLGITRTFVASLICYMASIGFFSDLDSGTSIPSRLRSAYRSFKSFCKLKHETPDIKQFSREGFKWKAPTKYPESSMFLGFQKHTFQACGFRVVGKSFCFYAWGL